MAAELPRAEERLGERGYLSWRIEEAGPYEQKLPIANQAADRSLFDSDELAIVERALAELAEHGGKGASLWSHEESAGWRLKSDGEEITYESGLIDVSPVDEEKRAALQQYVATLRP